MNDEIHSDPDLAAHITITKKRGICLYGESIDNIFPLVPVHDYVASIMGDFRDCIENIEEDPIYCTLNVIRVYWYLKEGIISSKQEAGEWGIFTFPIEQKETVRKAVECYSKDKKMYSFEKDELEQLKNYIVFHVQNELKNK
ncbi:DUF4111 domain-containing protein [Caldibacillus lycopersici]|uniref:DUF4111 domain-containing protein n=1 Tax=Perspicuibacillus lycopersici TaxID=1325689 RepID=A0AAE3LPB5_9BACI|nr:DUF4111 domain-containing protein [Perspicuibacillus lycopersici]MCU9614816.1 DUF4111 domain-containing protein [Perspicuibacillus lycopersici]